ncbi:TPA: membrane protein FxsA [Pasteurella multocida]|uniref:FxsA family protein n=1 Tax=Pasteurella multocida TaxID=747 RepID=UPI0028DFDF2F|nr:FxsA family protein [Pasteurella multocida]MDY0499890.1 membrane protein FxsA [Pasteurella multocida]MDY0655847.1 membrane protein FxsA [Pasteurella multocida]WRU40312.1 FxsA family protein [Pasteurella multocida]HDR1920736.1 membrane protein FxsA [Pasteurella multocida]HEA3244969.1 membrane protein FxsA [Pasteurella multocida]
MPLVLFLFIAFLFIYTELSLLVWIGSNIGVLSLILLLILSSLFGLFMIRARGWYTLLNVQKQLSQGEIPTRALLKSGIWIVAGILFFIPGFLTDLIALFLLIPITSLWIEKLITNKIHIVRSRFCRYSQKANHSQSEGEVFEAEYEKQVDEDKRIK